MSPPAKGLKHLTWLSVLDRLWTLENLDSGTAELLSA